MWCCAVYLMGSRTGLLRKVSFIDTQGDAAYSEGKRIVLYIIEQVWIHWRRLIVSAELVCIMFLEGHGELIEEVEALGCPLVREFWQLR